MGARPASLPDPYDEGLRLSAAGRLAEAIERFERALLARPDDVKVLFALGNTARALGLARPAEAFYRQVLSRDPQRLEALVNLANLLRAEGNYSAAEALLLPALAQDAQAADLWLALGSVYRQMGDDARAERHYREALRLQPNLVAALGNLADLLADRAEFDTALKLYDRALKLEPENAQARLNRAVLHLLKGNLKDGWRDYAARAKVPNKVPVGDHRLARWNGGPLRNVRLLVTAEQGIGDQIMFASVLPDLIANASEAGGSILLECEPRLVALFARSFPRAAVKPCQVEAKDGIVHARYGWLKAAGGANAAVELGTLPRYLRPALESFPAPHRYLMPDADEAARWRASLAEAGPAPFIGICWRSGDMRGERVMQFAALEHWAHFLRGAPPATFVCVQYDARAEEILQLEVMSGRKIVVPQGLDQKTEIDRACALLSALDAVVSAPTAVSWQAAALGVPTGKILYDRSWTSLGQSYEPFAPSCQCLSSDSHGDWMSAFEQARALIAPWR